MKRSEFTLFACEPNWIYPLCNTIGASALRMHDSALWGQMTEPFRFALDSEFLDMFGRLIPCRSAKTGLALPAIGGVIPLAMPCFFLNAIAPDIAARQWLLLRRRLFDKNGQLNRKAFWPIDTGNYHFTRASAYTATALAAAELGDHHVYKACMAALDEECPFVVEGGGTYRPKASVWAHGVELMARAGAKDRFRNLSAQTDKPGPKLDGLVYPDVLVAAAHNDKGGLKAVLYGQGRFPVRLTGLLKGHKYRFKGAAAGGFYANESGEIAFDIQLDGRTILNVNLEMK